MKTVLLVPGFREELTTRNYKSLIKAIEKVGYEVKFVKIQWQRTTIDDWIKKLENEYNKLNPKDVILAGFSYGAMTVLAEAAKREPYKLWLFSLSPYFSEDIPFIKLAWLRSIGKQRTERFWRLSFNEIAPRVNCDTTLFIGSKEISKYPDMNRRTEKAHQLLKRSRIVQAPNCGHDVTDKEYIQAIIQNI